MNTDQIAAEAAQEIKRFIAENEYANEVDFESIIQAAIEKAWEDGYQTAAKGNESIEKQLRAAQVGEEGETFNTLRSCRDHWKIAFNHEREKVILLSNQIHAIHGDKCICRICELVRTKRNEEIAESHAAQAGECDHQWTDYQTLHMPEQGPPLKIEQCVRCGVQRKKQGAAQASEPLGGDETSEDWARRCGEDV